MKKALSLLSISGLMTVILSSIAYAAPTIWDQVFSPFAGLPAAYGRYSFFIDGILAFIIFYGLVQFSLGKSLGGDAKGGKTIIVGISLVLSIGLAVWEKTSGFRLANFGWIAMIIFVGFITFIIYKGMIGFGIHKTTAIAAAYATFFFVTTFYGIAQRIEAQVPVLSGLMSIFFYIVLIWLFFKVGGAATSMFTQGKDPFPSSQQVASGAGTAGGWIKRFVGRGKKPETPKTPEEEAAAKLAAAAAKSATKKEAAKEEAAIEEVKEKVEEVKKKEFDEASLIKQAHENIIAVRKSMETNKNIGGASGFLNMFTDDARKITEAVANAQAARVIAKTTVGRAKKIIKLTKEHEIEATDDEKSALTKAKEVKAILYTTIKQGRTVRKLLEKEKSFGQRDKDEVIQTIKEMEDNYKIIYGHIQAIVDAEKRVIAEIEKKEAEVKKGAAKAEAASK